MTVHIVAGGQFGSEAKGHVAQIVGSMITGRPTSIRVGGPNAGHTCHTAKGERLALRQIPVGVVYPDHELHIGPGSEIDPGVLADELELCDGLGLAATERLSISPQATVLYRHHLDSEVKDGMRERLGSTAKGIGAARAARIQRTADLAPVLADRFHRVAFREISFDPNRDYLVEGTQGYGLGLHAGYYPFCTSGDVRNVDLLAQSGLPLTHDVLTWLVFRSFPIRVAGNSGPMHNERSWAELAEWSGGHIKPEHTTVTKLERRVGGWDPMLARRAMEANGGPSDSVRPVLTFLDYIVPEIAGLGMESFELAAEILQRSNDASLFLSSFVRSVGAQPTIMTTGPNSFLLEIS